MTSILANGSTQAVYLDMSGTSIKYSVGTLTTPSTYITIVTWPVTITNTGTPNVLRVSAANNLTISSSTGGTSGYLNAGSTHITFDGSGNTITINSIIGYPGFIQNGTSVFIGRPNITVQNFTTTQSQSTLLSGGWLCQAYFSKAVAGNTIINCTNNANIEDFSGNLVIDSGGIVGTLAATSGGTLSITGCTNNGNINTSNGGCGGIAAKSVGSPTNGVTYTNCINNGSIGSNGNNGGIAAGFLGNSTFINCVNNGNITSADSGGIVGGFAGFNRCLITILNCYNTGNITGQNAGGIAGSYFAYDTSRNCIISNCYNTGDISGNRAGGIVGAGVGYNDNAAYGNSVVDISNCYSLGVIRTTCGGICGGGSGITYTLKPTIRITNTYSSGTLVDASSGLVATSLTSTQINLTTTNTYVAAGSWTDASANAALTGDPTNLSTNNPGTTWTTIDTNTPYVLSAYNAALYSPSTGSTSGKTFTSGPGLFQGGYTYQLIYNTPQISGVTTTSVFVSLGTFPKYYSYNFNTFVLTNNGNTRDAVSVSINSSTGVISYYLPDPPCFLEGTKILSRKNNLEQYRPIQSLRKGDLVKTINHGYVPICMIGTTTIYNPGDTNRIPSRLYKCSKEKYPTLFEDLYITGCHSILVPFLTDEQWEKTKHTLGICITDNHFRLMAWVDERSQPFNKDGFFNIYHIALENSDYYMNYGIYANGLLVESCSKRYLKELSGMRLLGEEDCTASQYIHVENKVTQLIDTY